MSDFEEDENIEVEIDLMLRFDVFVFIKFFFN